MVNNNMLDKLRDFYKGKRVFVTGHTGFKGAWLSLWLCELGAKVTGYSLKPRTKPNLFELCGLEEEIYQVIGDIRDREALKNVFEIAKPEILFHMAAQSLVRYSYREPVETYETNVMGTVNIFEACRYSSSVRSIVNITSDKCYENVEKEEGYKEGDPLGGYDPYSSSKGCAELVTSAYMRSYFNEEKYSDHGVALASVRAGNVIGGGDWAEDRLVPDCVRALLKKNPVIVRYPEAVRPWQHVLDPLYGYLSLAQSLVEEGSRYSGAWNFGPDNDSAKKVKWVVQRIIEIWGENAAWELGSVSHPHEASCLKLDCSKVKSALGWRPIWDLSEALNKTIEWYKAYRDNKNILDFTISQIHDYQKSIEESNIYSEL